MMLVLCAAIVLFAPRRYALWGFLLLLCFVTTRQAVAIGGFNFYFPRIMVLIVGPLRGLIRNEWNSVRWNRMDVLVICFGTWYLVAGALNWNLNPAVLKERTGYIAELMGTYFLCRLLLRDVQDVKAAILGLATLAVPVLCLFLIERATARNLFAVFGGVSEVTPIRGDRLRCQGAFGHPIIAGVFWATMLPMIVAGVVAKWERSKRYLAGAIAAVGLVVLCASSTPVMGLAAGLGGWCLYRWRRHARHAFVALGLTTTALHLVMRAPVWSLIQRINITNGNSGYHRYLLVDGFIRHVHEWWLVGSGVGTAHWGHFTFDTANGFVAIGISAGLGALILFVAIIAEAFFAAGRIQKSDPALGWGVGVSIGVLCVCFLGISIWGHMHFAWAFPIAVASSLGLGAPQPTAAAVARTAEVSPQYKRLAPCMSDRSI